MSTYDRFNSKAEGREALSRATVDHELSPEALKYALDLYDKQMAEPRDPRDTLFLPMEAYLKPVFENRGRKRGFGRIVGYEAIEEYLEDCEAELDQILRRASWFAERLALKLRPPAPPAQPSKEALRKRKARAEGRVKPRAKKPPRTLADEVESRRKAVKTREAKLATLRSGGLEVTTSAIFRAEESLRRANKALQTYEERLNVST